MEEKLRKLREQSLQAIRESATLEALEAARVKYLGKKGELTAVLKQMAGLYAVFFGPYPVVKALAEPRKRWTEWIIKLLFFNAALTVAIFALKMTVFDLFNIKFGVPLYYLGGNVVFVIFDIAVSRALTVYMSRIHTKIGKGK